MPSYIRRLGEGFDGLRALMKFALPLLIKVSALKAMLVIRVWESRSDLGCHQLEFVSHRAVGCFNFLPSIFLALLSNFLPEKVLDD